ncbi:hypothetical protein FAM23167_02397 [Lentilactobacillus parabuchneri]|nr:hypothetical protein FAM23167_02397 [Lentilactobacillus parabuchneri]
MFPLYDQQALIKEKANSQAQLIQRLEKQLQADYQLSIQLHKVAGKTVSHTFTHQKWLIMLLEGNLSATADLSYFPGKWIQSTQFPKMAFSKVQSKMWEAFQNQRLSKK